MSVRQFVIAYVAAALVLLALDAVWLASMAERLYRAQIGHLMADRFALVPAIGFYVLYIAGVVAFAVAPAVVARRWPLALVKGAFLGLIAYATYDLTNQATLRDWPWRLTLVDLGWGTFLTAVAALAGYGAAAASPLSPPSDA